MFLSFSSFYFFILFQIVFEIVISESEWEYVFYCDDEG